MQSAGIDNLRLEKLQKNVGLVDAHLDTSDRCDVRKNGRPKAAVA